MRVFPGGLGPTIAVLQTERGGEGQGAPFFPSWAGQRFPPPPCIPPLGQGRLSALHKAGGAGRCPEPAPAMHPAPRRGASLEAAPSPRDTSAQVRRGTGTGGVGWAQVRREGWAQVRSGMRTGEERGMGMGGTSCAQVRSGMGTGGESWAQVRGAG